MPSSRLRLYDNLARDMPLIFTHIGTGTRTR
jgi:hypothetical protein